MVKNSSPIILWSINYSSMSTIRYSLITSIIDYSLITHRLLSHINTSLFSCYALQVLQISCFLVLIVSFVILLSVWYVFFFDFWVLLAVCQSQLYVGKCDGMCITIEWNYWNVVCNNREIRTIQRIGTNQHKLVVQSELIHKAYSQIWGSAQLSSGPLAHD